MKRIKEITIGILIIIGFLIYEIYKWFFAIPSNFKALNSLSGVMLKVPISILYVFISIMILYFISKFSFFKGIQIKGNNFGVRAKKSTLKEIFATIIYGLLVMSFGIGLIIILFTGTN